jgi:DNA-binding NarL/FixJ family response regulator
MPEGGGAGTPIGGPLITRLLIIADHPFAVQAIRLALRQTAGFEVVGLLGGREPLGSELEGLVPDVVLVDDGEDADEALARLREAARDTPDAKGILLTLRMDDDRIEEAFDAGADAVISKSIHPVALGTLLRETVNANVVHRHRRGGGVARAECPLTAREIEILGLAAQGMTNGSIGRELWITEQTVKFHLSNTYRKLGVTNRTEASRYAFLNGLVASRQPVAS